MAHTKEAKKQMLSDLKEKLANSKAAIFTDYAGTKVSKMQELRKELRENKIILKVTKNALLRKALKENNLTIEESILDKSLAVAFDNNDEVNPAKIIFNKAKETETIKILGALINKEFFDEQKTKALAQMPSREQLYAQMVGSIKAPITGIVNVLAGNLRGLVSVLNQYKEQKAK